MTLTQQGIDHVCQIFGNDGFCCVPSGLSWYYTTGGSDYNESGATAQVVSRLASGLVDSVTMTSPARGTFTKSDLDTANTQTVTLSDAQGIAFHDEPTEDQWCYVSISPLIIKNLTILPSDAIDTTTEWNITVDVENTTDVAMPSETLLFYIEGEEAAFHTEHNVGIPAYTTVNITTPIFTPLLAGVYQMCCTESIENLMCRLVNVTP